MSTAAQHSQTAAAEQAAAEWYARIRLGSPSAREQEDFDQWRALDPLHVRAYDDYERLWGALGPMSADPRIGAARRGLLATTSARRLRRARGLGAAVAAAVVLAAVAAMVSVGTGSSPGTSWRAELPAWLGGPETFATAIGQSSTVALDDGSSVVLNTASEIKPLYSATERAVRLTSGQALFDVAKNPARPFVVYAGDRRIVALGTSFDVRIDDERVTVTLVEGRVAVDTIAQPATAQPTELIPGQQWVANSGAAAQVRQTDLSAATSWREGRLVFSGEGLADAVLEVNRYSRTQIVLADPALGALRISGVFRTGQTAGFVAALEARFPVQVAAREAERIVIAPR